MTYRHIQFPLRFEVLACLGKLRRHENMFNNGTQNIGIDISNDREDISVEREVVDVNVVAVVARRASIVLLAERYTVAQTNCGVDVHTVERNFPHPLGTIFRLRCPLGVYESLL
jgi:hypothetical protein